MTKYDDEYIDQDENGKFINVKLYEGQVAVILEIESSDNIGFGLVEGPNDDISQDDAFSMATLARGMIGFTMEEPDRVIYMASMLMDKCKVDADNDVVVKEDVDWNGVLVLDGEVDLSKVEPEGNA